MADHPRIKILFLTTGLDCVAEVTHALRDRYQIIEADSIAELSSVLDGKQKPHAIVIGAHLRSRITDAADKAPIHALQRIFQGKFPLPVIAVPNKSPLPGKDLSPHDFPSLGNLYVVAYPFCEAELIRTLEHGLRRKKYQRSLALRTAAPPIIVFLAFLALWEVGCRWFEIRDFILPTPSKIGSTLIDNAGSLLFDMGLTSLEALLGFLLANVLSLILAVGFCHSRWVENSLYPYTIALKSVPIVAVAPLLVLWFGYGLWGKVVMASIIAFFPLVVNATLGLKAVDDEAMDLMHSLNASKWQILLKLRFPTAVPYIISALKISSTMAVVGAIVGEMAGARRGIGYLILISSYNLDTPMLFAAITLASLIGIFFFGALAVLDKIFALKYYQSRQ